MAAFQYKLEVIPPEYFGESVRSSIPQEDLQEGLTPWTHAPVPSGRFIEGLRALLPVDQSWGSSEEYCEEYVSADEGYSDLRIWQENGQVANIEFRFTPSVSPWLLMQSFLSLVAAESYLLVETKTGHVLLPKEPNVVTRLNMLYKSFQAGI